MLNFKLPLGKNNEFVKNCLKLVWRTDRIPALYPPLLNFMKNGFCLMGRGLVLAVIALAAFPVRGDTNRDAGGEWSLVDAKPVMAAASEITPEKYPDSDAVTVDQKSVRV